MLAARARPGDGRDSDEESNATNAKDGCGLQGISGRVSNPQATTGAPTEWDDEKAAYVAAHGATHHAAHELTTTRPMEGVIVKGCQRCGVVWFYRGEKFPGGNRTARKHCQFFASPRTPAQKIGCYRPWHSWGDPFQSSRVAGVVWFYRGGKFSGSQAMMSL
jgi:hypothetical protein